MDNEKLSNYLSTNFKPTDNFFRNTERENQIIMNERASLLISSSLTTNNFDSYLKLGHVSNQPGIYKLKFKYPLHLSEHTQQQSTEIWLKEFIINNKNNDDDLKNKTVFYRVHANDEPATYSVTQRVNKNANEEPSLNDCNFNNKANGILNKTTLFAHIQPFTPYNSHVKTCRFFGNSHLPFAPLKLSSGILKFDSFYNHESWESSNLEALRKEYPNWTEEVLVDFMFGNYWNETLRSFYLNQAFEKYYDGWFKKVYSFKNEYDEVVQKVIKYIDWNRFEKTLIPCTSWRQNNCAENCVFHVPLPKQQVLYNLDLLSKNTAETIFLTDSIELADLNQQDSPSSIVWTSWLCDNFDNVDWSPLKREGVDIYYLVVNHSDKSLEECYIEARKLAVFLKEKHGVDLKFVQVALDYNESDRHRMHLDSLTDVLNYRRSLQPNMINDGIHVMDSFEDFQEMHDKAEAAFETSPTYFWQKDAPEQSNESENDKTKNSEDLKAIPYLVRPAIVKGEVTMLHAPTKHGKSLFTYSLCAAIIARKKIFADKWWTVPKNDNYEMNKVLYLDFEAGKPRFDNNKKQFMYPYFPRNPEARQKYEDNFVFEDLKKETTNYSDPANHQKILDMIEEAKAKGTKGQPVDLVVIDTYTQFVGLEDVSTWSEIEPLMIKITSLGIAVLILHHSNAEGQSQGYNHKVKSLAGEIVIKTEKEDLKTKTLKDFRSIKLQNYRDSIIPLDNKPFDIQFLGGKWKAFDTSQELAEDGTKKRILSNKNKEFYEITEGYRENGFKATEVHKMMDIESTQYADIRKKGKE